MFRGPASELSPPEQFLLVMAAVPRLISKVREEERSGGVFGGGGGLGLCWLRVVLHQLDGYEGYG
jgi:hypothetical protein